MESPWHLAGHRACQKKESGRLKLSFNFTECPAGKEQFEANIQPIESTWSFLPVCISGPALISSRLFWKSLEDASFLLACVSHSEQVDDKNLFAINLTSVQGHVAILLSSGQDFFLETDLIYLLCLIVWSLLCFPDSTFVAFLLS